MRESEVLRFSEAYGFAHFVWSCFFEPDVSAGVEPLRVLGVRGRRVAERVGRPHRETLLHLLLIRLYRADYIEAFEKHRDDMLDLVVAEYEAVLDFNEVGYRKFELPDEEDPAFENAAWNRIAYLRRRLPVKRIAQDTFQLLFRDRRFLLRFNQELAQQLSSRPKVRRVSPPQWLKRAVFYRDNGRCVTCGKDLTGADYLGDTVHYDHIVPLAQHGTNDPTNFQLLCDACNLHKAAETDTSDRYSVFWSLP